MTAQEFLDLSTKLAADMKNWVTEAGKDDSFSPTDLETLSAAANIVERVTLREAATKSEVPPDGQILL